MNYIQYIVVAVHVNTYALMAYPHYTTPTGTPTSTTYPYGAYHPTALGAYAHPATPGTYSYQAAGYQTGVTGYGWTYPYSYVPQHPQSAAHPQRLPSQIPAPVGTQTTTSTPASTAPQRSSTFTSYTPSYLRESAVAAGTGGATGRGSRRQSNLRGLFTKECEATLRRYCKIIENLCYSEKPHVRFRRRS